METGEIYARLTEILREVFDVDDVVASPDLVAGRVRGWDSFGHLRFLFSVEQAFGITFAASQMSSLRNVGDLADLIAAKTSS